MMDVMATRIRGIESLTRYLVFDRWGVLYNNFTRLSPKDASISYEDSIFVAWSIDCKKTLNVTYMGECPYTGRQLLFYISIN